MLAQWVPANAWVFVLTHDHVTDYTLLKALTKRSDLNFLGLIGSSTKWQNFSRRLRRDGVSDGELLRVQCPIGAGRSQFKEPMAIAVDVVAKLLRDISESATTVNRHSTLRAGSGMQPVTRNLLREQTPGLFR
jgi:xanthine dehydrogenase accessory factor